MRVLIVSLNGCMQDLKSNSAGYQYPPVLLYSQTGKLLLLMCTVLRSTDRMGSDRASGINSG